MAGSIAILTLTNTSYQLGKQLKSSLIENEKVCLYGLDKYVEEKNEQYKNHQFKRGFSEIFNSYDHLVCIMATGIVVRHLAPLIQDKQKDPAVIVMDEKSQFVISLLSGHVGGGNALTREIAALMKAQAVITTATDVQDVTAIDILSQSINGWYANFKETTKKVNGLLAAHKEVALLDEENIVSDMRGLTLINNLANDVVDQHEATIAVSIRQLANLPSTCYQVVPKQFVLGMGAKKNTPLSVIEKEFEIFCGLHDIHARSIKKIVSIDLKKDEPGIIAFANQLEVPFETFKKEELEASSLKYPQSDFVKSIVGIGNVALSSADFATNGKVMTDRYGHNGVTFALGKD